MQQSTNYGYNELASQVTANVAANGGKRYTLNRYQGDSGTQKESDYIISPAIDRLFDHVLGPANTLSIALTSTTRLDYTPNVPTSVDPSSLMVALDTEKGKPSLVGNKPYFDSHYQSVGLFGVGESLFFRDMMVVMILSVASHNNGEEMVHCYLQVTPTNLVLPTGQDSTYWTLAKSFGHLATSGLVANLCYAQSSRFEVPTLTCSTYMVSDEIPASLYFRGKALFRKLMQDNNSESTGVDLLYAQQDSLYGQEIAGCIGFYRGVPTFDLRPTEKPSQPGYALGNLKISTPLVALVCQSVRGLTDQYEAVATGELETVFLYNGSNGPVLLPIRCSITGFRSPLYFRLNLSAMLLSMTLTSADIESLLDGVNWSEVSEQMPSGMTLSDHQVPLGFTIGLDPRTQQLKNFVSLLELTVANRAPWTIVDNGTALLQVDTVRLMFMLREPANSSRRSLSISLFAQMEVGTHGGAFNFSCDPSVGRILLTLDEGRVTLEDLVGLFMGGAEVDCPDIALGEFQLVIEARTGYYDGEFNLEARWPFELGGVVVTFEELGLKMSYDEKKGAHFFLIGMVELSGVLDSRLMMRASYPGSQVGWTFTGTAKSKSENIGDLVDSLVTFFGGTADHLPTFIQTLAINEVKVRFNTKTKSWAFTVEASWKDSTQDTTPSAMVILTIKNKVRAQGRSQLVFSGVLRFFDESGNPVFEFDLIFDTTSSGRDMFIAYYQSDDPKDTTLSNLLGQILDNPPELQPVTISLLEGLFCYDETSGTGRELFCLGMGAALDLSALGDLPIIGPLFEDAPDLDIAMQLLYATASFSQQDMFVLNSLLRGKKVHFPQADTSGILAGFSYAMLLRLGEGEAIPLDFGPALPPGWPVKNSVSGRPDPAAMAVVKSQEHIAWIRVQKTFGPLNISRVGFSLKSEAITGYIDAELNIDVFKASFIELYLSFGFAEQGGFADINFGLNGLGLQFSVDPVTVAGTFLYSDANGEPEYDGYASLKVGPLMLSALGSYASDDTGHPSLFLFAVADFPLGGPGFCFITGLSAGFGFNRDLLLPPVSQVPQYWMVEEAVGPPKNFYRTPNSPANNPLYQIVASANIYAPPAPGQYWLAAGLSFTTYEIVNSLVVLSVGFGNRFMVDVIGLSTVCMPPTPGNNISPIGMAQLALEGSFTVESDPYAVDILIQGQLTPSSYIFTRSCRLTGGFAFGLWMGGSQGGDFVVTFGGYHPDYKPPSYYPRVPRVGFSWRMGTYLNAKGNMYFALTPSAIMVGGLLEILFQLAVSGPVPSLRVSFDLSLDFLLNWQPYHYQVATVAEVEVSVVIKSFGTHDISVGAGADMNLWGPNFGGTAELQMSILFIKIHFDVSFGASDQGAEPATFSEFQQSFLPAQTSPSTTAATPSPQAEDGSSEPDTSPPDDVNTPPGAVYWNYVSANVSTGLSRKVQVTQGPSTYNFSIVDPKHLVISTSAVTPITSVSGWSSVDTSSFQTTGLGVAPLNCAITEAVHSLLIEKSDPKTGALSPDTDNFVAEPYPKSIPTALWNPQMLDTTNPASVNAPSLIENTVGGVVIRPKTPVQPGESRNYLRKMFRFETTPQQAFAWENAGQFQPDPPPGESQRSNREALLQVQQSLTADDTNTTRAGLLTALGFTSTTLTLNASLLEDTAYAPHSGTFVSQEVSA